MKSNTIGVALITGARSEQGRKQPNTYATAITQYVEAGGTRYAYRRMGREAGVPLIWPPQMKEPFNDEPF